MTQWEYAELTFTYTSEYSDQDASGRAAWQRERFASSVRAWERRVPTLWWKGPDGQTQELTRDGLDAVDVLNEKGSEGWELVTARERAWSAKLLLFSEIHSFTTTCYLLKRAQVR